jgi:ABC-type sugar transport system permease subunit
VATALSTLFFVVMVALSFVVIRVMQRSEVV